MIPKRTNFIGIRLDVILLFVTADNVHARDPFDILQLRANDPILDLAEIRGQFDFGLEPLAFRSEIRAIALPTGFASATVRASVPRGWTYSTVHM